MRYQAGDIVLTRGRAWVSGVIRRLTQSRGETITLANHVGVLVSGADRLADAVIVEAQLRVMRHRVGAQYRILSDSLAVFRPVTLTPNEIEAVKVKAVSYVGRRYGVVKLVLHLGDWCLGGRYILRRLGALDEYPICSYLVAAAFAAIGKDFGVSERAASPDDIWDFCVNSRHYQMVRPLGPLT